MEYLLAANMCQANKGRYADAVQLYRKGFAADPNLPAKIPERVRADAARAAVLAAAGKGIDAPRAEERGKYREYALSWMQAEMAAMKRKPSPVILAGWLADPAWANVRHPFYLAALSTDEAGAWRELWDNVRELRDRAK
jgi:hypothetical protein